MRECGENKPEKKLVQKLSEIQAKKLPLRTAEGATVACTSVD